MEEEKAFSRRQYSRDYRKRREEFCRQVDRPDLVSNLSDERTDEVQLYKESRS
jgi:hypothetical protein